MQSFTGGGGGMTDGVLNGATFDSGTKMLTLTIDTGDSFPVDLSSFLNADRDSALQSPRP